jgi:hypothetical protein
MVPKQNLSKHDFKTGKPKKKRGRPPRAFSHQQSDELIRSIHETQRALGRMGRTIGSLGEGAIRGPIEKSRTEKFFELPTLVKISWVSLFTLFIIPTFVMLFFFVVDNLVGGRTFNPEGVAYYDIYMDALSVIRIFGICISGLTLSIHTLWKSK